MVEWIRTHSPGQQQYLEVSSIKEGEQHLANEALPPY